MSLSLVCGGEGLSSGAHRPEFKFKQYPPTPSNGMRSLARSLPLQVSPSPSAKWGENTYISVLCRFNEIRHPHFLACCQAWSNPRAHVIYT